MIASNSIEYSEIESLFGGACTVLIEGKSILKPKRSPSGILAKRSSKPALRSSRFQASTLYGVNGLSFLSSRASLSAVGGCSASRTYVTCIVFGSGATFFALPACTDLFSVFGPKTFADALGKCLKLIVPRTRGGAFHGTMRVPSQAYCATR